MMEYLDDIRAGKNVREAQEKVYLFLEERLLVPLRSSMPESLRARLDAEDVLHEAFLRALAGLDRARIPGERAFAAWVYRIARNLVVDQTRRRSSAALAFGRDTQAAAPRASRLPARGRGIETMVQRHDWIEAALSKLKPREAEVIRLHKLAGKSFREIAEGWKKEPATIKRLYSLAMRNLRRVAGEAEPHRQG